MKMKAVLYSLFLLFMVANLNYGDEWWRSWFKQTISYHSILTPVDLDSDVFYLTNYTYPGAPLPAWTNDMAFVLEYISMISLGYFTNQNPDFSGLTDIRDLIPTDKFMLEFKAKALGNYRYEILLVGIDKMDKDNEDSYVDILGSGSGVLLTDQITKNKQYPYTGDYLYNHLTHFDLTTSWETIQIVIDINVLNSFIPPFCNDDVYCLCFGNFSGFSPFEIKDIQLYVIY